MPRTPFNTGRIQADYGQYTYLVADEFKWSPDVATIYHPVLASQKDAWSLLHEIAHAELGHQTYGLDIELVHHEMAAWEYAVNVLAAHYGLQIDEDYIQDHLDTYRLWLHERSTCPDCSQTGLQTKNTYRCVNCRCFWRANEARVCSLRRTKLLQ